MQLAIVVGLEHDSPWHKVIVIKAPNYQWPILLSIPYHFFPIGSSYHMK